MGSAPLIWNISPLTGYTGTSGAFGMTLNSEERITSPDSGLGPNPSIVTILSATATDNGATVQCGIANEESSQMITLSTRE